MNADTLTCLTCGTHRPVPNPKIRVNTRNVYDCRKCDAPQVHIAGLSKLPRAQHADTRKTRTI